ncbi:translocation protein TolB [Maioricimonas rarisocia]|uniref:Translocation protein TolB n=1 Tax=Maioricimonas rarisocia TaxID=2528026 RepID=A0A517ZEV2_9PLAN|nr:c-type cytochrome domain-containing protein [Maioricimonas rarisocia]QDU40998.1 translocation protein TolB [Maioricimonas rarisocia]
MRSILTLLFLLVLPLEISAETTGPDYQTDVAPILKKYCAGCHNDGDREGDFSLESYASLQKGTDDGPAFLPGDAENSRLIRLLTGAAEPLMPPEDEPRPSEQEVATLKAWIEAGAKGPEGVEPDRLQLIVPSIESHAKQQPVAALDLSPDGDRLAVARYSQVTLHKAATQEGAAVAVDEGRTVGAYPGKVTSVAFSPDGSRLITASGVTGLGGVAAIWNVDDGELVREFRGHRDILYDATLSPDGTLLATCSYDKTIILWDVASGEQLRTLSGHNGAVYDVAFSPDGQFLVSASADDTCKVWRVSDGERMDTLGQPLKEAYCCTFSPDGRFIVAGGADNSLRVWRFVSKDRPRINPQVIARFAHEGPIVQLEFTPDGSKLVSVAEDRTVKVWNTRGYRELKLWENEPEVAMALTVGPAGESFVLGRMDGTLARYAIPAGPSGSGEQGPAEIEAVAVTAGDIQTVKEQEPNNTPAEAATVQVPAEISGTIAGKVGDAADFDLYRFAAKAGEEWVIEVNAARSKSPLDSFVEVLDADGNRIERVLLQAVRDSYFTFRGKNADQANDFRIFNWEEMELNEYLYANGEVVKLWLYPRGPDSGFNVYPGAGKRWGYFDTTPLAHALGEPAYIVQPHPPGTELIPNGLPVFRLYYENDDDARRQLGNDSKLFFTAPADGEYLVKIKDVRGYEQKDFSYKLAIRPRKPDFKVTLHGANPSVEPGSSKEFRVTVNRMDNFDGPIRVDISGLPRGFHATTPIVIEEGQIEAMGVIQADQDAAKPTSENAKATRVLAKAEIRGQEVVHEANNLGEIKLGEAPKLLVTILPADGGAVPVATPPDGPMEFEIQPGETIMLKVRVERSGQKGLVSFGKEGAGRNLPFGLYVDNVGLNGLLIPEDEEVRDFFITAANWVPGQSRLFHLKAAQAGGVTSQPVLLHVRGKEQVAER